MRICPRSIRMLPVLTVALLVFKAAAAQVYASEEEAARHTRALTMFNNVCLQSLPDFEEAEQRFAASGLAGEPQGFWTDADSELIARTTRSENGRQRACFLALDAANVTALNAELGDLLAAALRRANVGVMPGPTPGDPVLYMVDYGEYRVTAVVAHVSRGYGMLTVGVDVKEGATPPWGSE